MHSAFDPYGTMRILDVNPSIFCVLRVDARDRPVLCLHNVSDQLQIAEPKSRVASPHAAEAAVRAMSARGVTTCDVFGAEFNELVDLISSERFDANESLRLAPYQTLWLTTPA